MEPSTDITSPDHPALDALCGQLRSLDDAVDHENRWPAQSLELCGQAGVFRWFLPVRWGGFEWSEPEIVRGYIALAKASLATAFVITQRSSACRWLADGESRVAERWLPGLASGEHFATVGISHLSTSRRHLARPVLEVEETPDGFRLTGYSPWVTGAAHAQVLVTGGTLADGNQVLVAVDTSRPGIEVEPPAELIALSSTFTGAVRFRDALVPREALVAGPHQRVLAARGSGGPGGLTTSALACGLAAAASGYLNEQSSARPDLTPIAAGLQREADQLARDLVLAAGGSGDCSSEDLRTRANSLVLRATQAALTAAKGSGYLRSHPTGRWCRQALFFLVWSCPQPVMHATLCELAGLWDD